MKRLFGKFVGWRNRESIHCVWEAKWEIDNDAFGEKCKYLQIAGEDCTDHDGVALLLKGILFDRDAFWMINSSGNSITDVMKCRWSMRGSKKLLIEFLQGPGVWEEATNALCMRLGVNIVDYSNTEDKLSAWLGTGANGRVFRLIDDKVLKIVVGRNSDKVEREFNVMVSLYNRDDVSHLVFPVVEGSFREGVIGTFKYAGYLLACEGQKINSPVTLKLKADLAAALYELHQNNIIHGDPRIQNALILGDTVKWIDFRCSETVSFKVGIRHDVEILLASLGGNVKQNSTNIDAYVTAPSLLNLHSILLI